MIGIQVGQVGEAQGRRKIIHVHLKPYSVTSDSKPEIFALVVALIAVDTVPPQ